MADGNVTVDRFSPSGRALLGCRCSPRFAKANFVDDESRAIERVGRKDGGIAAGRDGEISRNGGQKVRARSEKSGVADCWVVQGESPLPRQERTRCSPRATSRSRELLASEIHAQVLPSRLFFFLKKTGGKIKRARGKDPATFDAVNEFLPYRINSSQLI